MSIDDCRICGPFCNCHVHRGYYPSHWDSDYDGYLLQLGMSDADFKDWVNPDEGDR